MTSASPPRGLLLALALALAAGCTRYRAVTPELFKELRLNNINPKDVQYFLSEDLKLRRVLKQGEVVTRGAEVVTINEKRIVELDIECRTPCVLLRQGRRVSRDDPTQIVEAPYEGEVLEQQFEVGVERGLSFDSRTGYRYRLVLDHNGKARYNDRLWRVTYGGDGPPYLLYNPDEIDERILDKRTLPGVRVGERPSAPPAEREGASPP